MKVLLTGGAGYIGSHTAVEMLEAGYDVVIAARSRCLTAPFAALEASFLSACASLGLTREPEDTP